MAIQILYSDAALVAVNKPPGLSVHDAPGPGSSILRELRAEHSLTGLVPVHRLDKDASGVLLLARSKDAARALERRWDEVEKTYLAVCGGMPLGRAGVISAPILENQTGKPERLERALRSFAKLQPGVKVPPVPAPKTSGVHPAGRQAQTEYRVLEVFVRPKPRSATARRAQQRQYLSVVEVRPRQGRMHQIRVHLAHIGCPIIGDALYDKQSNGTECGIERLALHAAKLVFPHPSEPDKRVTIEAPLPDDIGAVWNALKKRGRRAAG
jgi:23S rRNA-/tRNA-specific pseudouridylate synthase